MIVYPDSQGRVRIIDVGNSDGVKRRPNTKIVPLPVAVESTN